MRIHRLIASVIAVGLVLLIAGPTLADDERDDSNASLKGKYRFSSVRTCTDTATGSLVHVYFSGTILYDGNGTTRFTDRGTAFLPGPTSLSFEEIGELTYSVRPNGSFTQEGTFTATDQSYILTGAKMTGQIDAQGSVLVFSAAIPPVKETLTFPDGRYTERFCGSSGTAVRIRD